MWSVHIQLRREHSLCSVFKNIAFHSFQHFCDKDSCKHERNASKKEHEISPICL